MKKYIFILFFLFFNLVAQSQNTFVADDNFEQALIDLGYDTASLDNFVLAADISAVTTLDITGLNIQDLTGIEDFAALTTFNCGDNALTSINVSANTFLTTLECYDNQLTSLDISQNGNLEILFAYQNQLTSIDFSNNTQLLNVNIGDNLLTQIDVSSNAALQILEVNNNSLTNIDITQNSNLLEFQCINNQLSVIDVSLNSELGLFFCSDNLLTQVDVRNNLKLEHFVCNNNLLTDVDITENQILLSFFCHDNQLTSINLTNNLLLRTLSFNNNMITDVDVTNNLLLAIISCDNNPLTTIDLRRNTALSSFVGRFTTLQTIDLRNGNNMNITSINATNNPDLDCIFVDDVNFSNANFGIGIDANTSFAASEAECGGTSCQISVDTLMNIEVIGSYILPSLSEGSYFTGFGGTGTLLFAGDMITSSQQIFIYNVSPTDATCSAQSNFIVTILQSLSCTIPEFFTPNKDSINDLWNVNCNSDVINYIDIFNRYGKLIYKIKSSTDNGWDGNYAGRLMPSNTYWYRINFSDGSKKRGYFSLRR